MAANAANTSEIMAAHSDGMDWFLLTKPFLSVESETNKHCEIIELCQNIVKSEEDILRNAKVDAILLNNFVLAAVDYINSNIDQVPLGQIATVSEATSILLQYLVRFLSSYGSVKITDTGSNAVEHCLKAVKSLCLGDSVLNASEFAALVSKIKASLPSKDAELPTGSDKEPSKSEANKGRSDLSAAILEQLIVPIRDTKENNSPVTDQGNTSINPVGNENSDLKSDVTKTILKCNIEIMQSLKAGEILIDFCLKLPSIKKANSKIEEAMSGKIFSVPINHNEAIAVKNSLHSTLADISLISIVLHLPLIEPLSQTKMDKLHRLCIALLYCTVAQSAASAVLGLMTASASGGTTSSTTGSSTAASAGSTAASGGTLPSKGSSGGKDGGKIDGKEGSGIEDPDAHAVILIEEVLGLYEYVGKVIKTSTRAGGNVYQNHLLSGAWVLVSGLQSHISSYCTSQPVSSTINTPPRTAGDEAISAPPSPKPTTTRSPSKGRLSEMVPSTTAATAGAVGSGGGSVRSWLIKFQQSFGVLSVALVDKAIVLMSELFEDLQLEIAEGASSISQVEPAQITNILAQSTALQRVARILTAAPLNQLLFYITIVSYRKACSLKRIRLGSDGAPGDTGSQSDSTTYFDDMIMCSDDSSTEEEEEEEEEDSEPILGLWFEETISAPPGESKDSKNSSITENPDVKPAQHERNTSIVPEKGEAHGFIALSTNIFAFMNKYLLGTKSEYVTNYVQTGLGEQQVLILASIIKDLDRETARTEVVTINRCFGAALGQLYCDFSGALARFSHNFITHRSLQHLQASLLSHLGVSPWNKDQPHGWPLQVYPRTLAVLAQTLLQRPSNEKEASVIGIWHRVVNTLIDNVVNVPQQPANEQAVPQEHEDLNVEHAQVLLYLFHSLNLMQKKSVVLLMAGGILRCSEIGRSSEVKELQLLYLSRVLLLFDYIMKHLYDAPQQLLEQIQWNLFYSTNLKTDSDKEHNMLTKLFTPWNEIEKYYRLRNISDDFVSMKPRFYVVTNVEVNNQETPKLDGLACNFILGTPDKLRYPFLLDALIEILNVTKFCAVKQLSFLGLCAVQYCFSICWRLLLLLPPSNTYIERLSSGEQQMPGLLLLHSLVWGARTNHKNFSRWLKDCLVKQGVYTQQTERMLKSASDTINNLRYDVSTARSCILALTPDVKNGPMTQDKLPALWHVILLDSVIAKMQLSLIDESDTNTADASGNTVSGSIYVRDLMPNVLKLAKAILHQTRWSLLTNMMVGSSSVANPNQSTAADIEDILAVASTKNSLTSTLTTDLITMLPSIVPYVLQGWNRSMLEECSMTPFLNDIIPSESYILKIVETHISTLTLENTFSINFSLKRLLFCLTKFICQHVTKIENTDTKRIAINYLVQVTLDVRTEYIYETVCKVLDKLIGDSESEKHQIQVYLQVLKSTYRTITNYVKNPNDLINEKILHNVLKFYEKMLDKPTGRQAMEAFFTGDRDLVEILMSVGNSHISSQYSARILHFFNRLFFCAEKWPTDTSLNYLCSSMSKIAKVDAVRLQAWLKYIIIGSSESNVNVPADMDIIQPDSKEPSPKSDNEAPTSNKSETVPQQGTAYESNASISSPAVTTVVCLDDPQQRSLTMENTQLLQSLTNFFVKQNVANPISEEISLTILKAMITLVTQSLNATLEGTTFTDLISVMTTLADAGVGRGHVYLFPAMAEWLDECREYLLEHSVTEPKGEIIDDKCKLRLDASASMVEYLSDVLSGLHSMTSFRALSPPWEGEMPLEQDPDWIEEADNDDDSGEDSDEDSLCNKICTFTVTQKEFMNQHWYNCHTCRMLDGVGVCSICARVCHRGHDLSYAKYGNFFCDCGAKEDGSCLALVRRSPQSNQQQQQQQQQPQISSSDLPSTANVPASTNAAEQLHSSLRRNKEQSESQHHQQSDSRTGTLSKNSSRAASCRIKQFEGCRQWILNYLGHSPLPLTLLQLLKTLLPAVEVTCSRNSPVGCHARAMSALHQLHQSNKKYIASDQLMVPTLGSQEGAFENVRMNYTGEQGQTIRQLLSAHIVRRVAMCCTASTHGRRQHLAVAHEKGKITILQLSTLLKQADSSSRKLTLTRLSSAPIPFTVLTLTANHCNEDFLSVCGLKECHVLTFNANGTVIDHLVLHPQLETGNFIIKSIWLPGSQTCLALITADFVKIYDLSKDALSPQYYFLVPSGKIRDCTFMYDDGMYTILLMSSPGHIYTELLNEDSSAKHGSFYVTNTLEVFHLDVTDVNGQVAGGGVSIYYSHTLRLLFYSYAQGKSFISPLMPKSNCLTVVFPITLSTAPPTAKNNGSSKSSASSSSSINPQSLCQWMEVPNHPGLICCSMQSSNNPVIIMLRPDSIAIQEMKIVQSKAKIMDTVAIRHNSPSGTSISGGSNNGEPRTTLILLCEDGSLKIFMANMETTGFWLSPNMQPSVQSSPMGFMKHGASGGGARKKQCAGKGKVVGPKLQLGGGAVGLPVDFFEHCQPMNDVDIGGNDLLQIYNAAQLKHRLNTKGLYIACTRTLGFTIEITNADSGMVMCGVRVLVGSQEPQRAPSYIEIFGRAINVNVTRSRWYDVPFTREESLQADRKLNVVFGPSQDPDTSVTMVDSIKIFGKTKESFGWPEEIDEPISSTSLAAMSSANVFNDVENVSSAKVISLSKLEKLVTGVLEVLDGTFLLYGNEDKLADHKSECITIATQLLTLPIPPALQIHSTDLLCALHTTKQQYHAYKDQALLQHVLISLNAMSELNASATDGSGDIDAESYFRLVMIVRGVAAARPQNLIKFSESQTPIQNSNLDDPLNDSARARPPVKNAHLLLQLMDVLWLLHAANPENPALAPVVAPGLKHTEQVIFALVEIIHAFNTCDTYSSISLGVYMQLLLCKDSVIAFSTRYALSRVQRPRCKRRKVFIPSPAQCATPPSKTSVESEEDNKAIASASTHRGRDGAGPSSSRNSDPDQESMRDAVNALVRYRDEQRTARPPTVSNPGAGVGASNATTTASAAIAAVVNPIEALLAGAVGGPGGGGGGGGGGSGFQPLLDIPPDADDETMVEIAIALSLQEQDGDQAAGLGGIHQMLSNPLLNQIAQGHLQGAEAGHFSDTTASAGGSDDEGSTAATDGSTLRTSPAEQGGSVGSESGGSGVESITGDHNVSGRSSAYGDNIQEAISIVSRSENSIATTNYQAGEIDVNQPENDDSENANKLHLLRLQLLEKMIEYLPKLRHVSGIRSIPFFQVILQLTSDLDGTSERDKMCLNNLLTALTTELDLLKPDFTAMCIRTEQREVQLVILRLLSVILSRTKSIPSPTTSTTLGRQQPGGMDSILFVASVTATHLYRNCFIPYCLGVLRTQLAYWRKTTGDDGTGVVQVAQVVGGNLLKEFQSQTPPDLSPFFLRQFVKGNASDIFATYNQLIMEVALRLPYQVYRQADPTQQQPQAGPSTSQPTVVHSVSQAFSHDWFGLLCEYMMCSTQGNCVRRQVRKLLLFIAGGKDQYRQTRDIHAIEAHIKAVKLHCTKGGFDPSATCQQYVSLPYDTLVEMVEHLKACLEIALSRVGNWQKFCLEHNDIIPLLFQVSCFLDEGVAPNILQLLNCAVVASNRKQETTKPMIHTDRERSDDSTTEAAFDNAICIKLINCINKNVREENLIRFIKTFILETNTSAVRWQAHSLLLAMYQNSNLDHQEALLNILWKLWPSLPTYGRKASQYIDLLGYFTLQASQKTNSKVEMSAFVDQAVGVLGIQNDLLAHHPNANLYSYLAQYVDIEGYYLEAEPCLVCNNPEIQLATIKLNSVKVDSKYTTTTQIMKLVSSHTISRIIIRIADLKRTKMVRCIQIYYNNRNVLAIVELKNKPALWHKAKKVTIPSGQTEVKIEFPLPIVACNLMVEYSDFYENVQASTETHQCPRCSAAVPANPGVCSNCGENVFQCHKCRAINYDEKDPFLCHSCGFCKYAKFDFTLLAKPCCAVEAIDNDEDRKKMVGNINMSLEKADRIYKQLMANKPCLENLLVRVSECSADRRSDEAATSQSGNATQAAASVVSSAANSAHQNKINKTIQILAQQYGTECKTSFEELSRIIQKVLISRKELIAYDRRQTGTASVSALSSDQVYDPRLRSRGSQCYGCSSAATDHCLTLLRSMALNPETRQELCKKGLIQELLKKNLRRGTMQTQDDVRHLICILNRDNSTSTFTTCNLITSMITSRLVNNPSDLRCRPEVALLAALQRLHDSLWTVRLRCLVRLYLRTVRAADCRNPVVTDAVLLPCLKMWYDMCCSSGGRTVTMADEVGNVGEGTSSAAGSKKAAKDKSNSSSAASIPKQGSDPSPVNISKWISKESQYEDWQGKLGTSHKSGNVSKTKEQMRKIYLLEKYGLRWRQQVLPTPPPPFTDEMCEASWVKTLMFNQSSRPTRQVICNILEQCCTGYKRKRKILCILTNYLDEVSVAGEHASEFLSLYQNLISEYGWKQYLTVQGVLYSLADLITSEIEQLHCLEQTSLTSNLTQGYALSRLTDLLASFLVNPAIRRRHKSRLVAAVLNGYLALRRLVVQRTRIIDDTQEKLLELLEVMTTGNEEETKAYMSVCIDAVDNCSPHDYQTPVFIFERLCNIIYPEENDSGEFFLTLEKDAQQEDFLQGRMLGNPYSSSEAGLGPLMRDVKNKICQDCELVALLEDDNGMELLVNNKIMSLDLPVKDVYKKVWLAEGGDADSMRVIYRMRGLLGDATEEFVETLANKAQAAVNNEEVYKMANVLAECEGLQVMLTRLGAIQNLARAKPLLQVLLKLFRLSVKVERVQEVLIQPELAAMTVFLRTLQLSLESTSHSSSATSAASQSTTGNAQSTTADSTQSTEQLLDIMETILSRATSQPLDDFKRFARTCGGPEYVRSLLSFTNHASVRRNTSVLVHLTRVLAGMVYCSEEKTKILLDHFRPVFDFNLFDFEATPSDQQRLEMFCVLTQGIERNVIGNTLKDDIIELGLVREALEYIGMHAPCVKPTLLRTDSDELKEFITKPALKYILRLLAGLAYAHENTQLAIAAADTIPIIHRLEQVSSDEHVGTLAENLLEALRTNPAVASKIEEVREFTRSEKKRLAMAMREKQLGQLGMRTNDKGQVTAKSIHLQQMEELGEETGLVCCICREGYKYQPSKVLAIYTFTKRCNIDDYEAKARKTMGYSTVTHFNIVHVDCHMSAVRLARARDEWESAALQNASTKCNGLLPLWGPQVAESAFASCLARHNAYLQESTSHRDVGHDARSTVHDLKLLLLRFAQERSFHEDTGGGGPQSNLHMVPYLIHMGLYVINTTRVSKKEDSSLTTYLSISDLDRCIESAFEADGPLYWITLSLLLQSNQRWQSSRLAHLRRLLILAHARACTPTGQGLKSFTTNQDHMMLRPYVAYKPYLIYYALIDGIYRHFFKNVTGLDEQWSSNLADYIRHNDEQLLKASERLLETYTEEIVPCSSFTEFCDVAGLLDVIEDPEKYLNDLLHEV